MEKILCCNGELKKIRGKYVDLVDYRVRNDPLSGPHTYDDSQVLSGFVRRLLVNSNHQNERIDSKTRLCWEERKKSSLTRHSLGDGINSRVGIKSSAGAAQTAKSMNSSQTELPL